MLAKHMNQSNKQIAVIGAGKLGLALAHLLAKSGYQVTIGARKPAARINTFQKLALRPSDLPPIVSYRQATRHADLSLLTIADDAISETCRILATDFKPNSIVAHCSGALDSTILASAAARGCKVASLHPLNTFPSIQAALQLLKNQQHNTSLYCEGDSAALQFSEGVFSRAGFKVVCIDKSSKPLYHAACVFACNYLTSLMDLSLQSAQAAQLPPEDFWQSLQPLITTTLNNISGEGTVDALSGPISRGDVDTVAKHLTVLYEQSAELARCYAVLGQRTLALTERRGDIEQAKIGHLRKLLDGYIKLSRD